MKTKTISLRMPLDVYEQAKEKARQDRTTVTAVALKAVAKEVKPSLQPTKASV